MEDNVRTARREAGDLFIAYFVDRDATPFGFRPLISAALVDKPLQVGGGGGTAFDRKEKIIQCKKGGHEQAGVNDGIPGDDLVDAPAPNDQAGLADLDRAGTDGAGVHVK